jgi:hypothetical protein
MQFHVTWPITVILIGWAAFHFWLAARQQVFQVSDEQGIQITERELFVVFGIYWCVMAFRVPWKSRADRLLVRLAEDYVDRHAQAESERIHSMVSNARTATTKGAEQIADGNRPQATQSPDKH